MTLAALRCWRTPKPLSALLQYSLQVRLSYRWDGRRVYYFLQVHAYHPIGTFLRCRCESNIQLRQKAYKFCKKAMRSLHSFSYKNIERSMTRFLSSCAFYFSCFSLWHRYLHTLHTHTYKYVYVCFSMWTKTEKSTLPASE